MATFLSRPGFKPVKHLTGAPYNGQANVYINTGATSLVPGDVVTAAADISAGGIPNCTIGTASAVPLGIVVGVINAKFDPITGKLSTGSISLDTPQVCAQNGLCLVADSPDLVMEAEIATYAVTNGNRNHQLDPTSYNTTTGGSNMKITYNAGAQTDPFKLIGAVQRADSVSGSGYTNPVDADANVKVLVVFNTHQYRDAGGTVSV